MAKMHLCLCLHKEASGQHLLLPSLSTLFVLVLFCFEIRSLTKLELAVSDTLADWQQAPGINLFLPQSSAYGNVWLYSVFTSGIEIQTQALILDKQFYPLNHLLSPTWFRLTILKTEKNRKMKAEIRLFISK